MDKKHRGCSSELIACNWLLEQGYDVFRNISAHGYADLVAINWETGEKIWVDVKTGTYTQGRDIRGCVTCIPAPKSPYALSEVQKVAGIKVLFVFYRENICEWG